MLSSGVGPDEHGGIQHSPLISASQRQAPHSTADLPLCARPEVIKQIHERMVPIARDHRVGDGCASGTESLQTHRWSGMDSKFQFRAR